MNYKPFLACVLALGVTGVSNAAQAPGRDTPDFVFTVPMELKNIPGEVHTVIVWCEALNATYNEGTGREPSSGAGTDARLLQFRAGPQVIASTGAVSIPVRGHQFHQGVKGTGGPADKPFPAWSVDRVEGMSRGSAKPFVPRFGGKLDTAELAQLPAMSYMIVPKAGTSNATQGAGVVLAANTTGAIDPALGTAFACHMGFKANAMIDGKNTDFDIFAGAGSYESMPDELSKDAKFSDAKGIETKGGVSGVNPAKILNIYGNFPPAQKPGSKPLTK